MDNALVQAVGLVSLSVFYCDFLVLFLYPFFPAVPLVTVPAVFWQGLRWTLIRLALSVPAAGMILFAGYLLSVPSGQGPPIVSFLVSGTCVLLCALVVYYLVVDGHKKVRPPLGPLRALLDLVIDTRGTATIAAAHTKVLNTALLQVFQALFKLILVVVVLRSWNRFKSRKSAPDIYMGPDGSLIKDETPLPLLSAIFRCALYSVFLYLFLSAVWDVGVALVTVIFRVKLLPMWNAPFASSSPRDFWGRRWNTVFRALYNQSILRGLLQGALAWERVKRARSVKLSARPDGLDSVDEQSADFLSSSPPLPSAATTTAVGKKSSSVQAKDSQRAPSKPAAAASRTFTTDNDPLYSFLSVNTVFLFSGLLHEYIVYCTFGEVTGEVLLFFMLQANICVVQAYLERRFPQTAALLVSESVAPSITVTLLIMVATSHLFFAPFIRHNFFETELTRFLEPLVTV